MEFMEDHIKQLVEEIRKKTKYVLSSLNTVFQCFAGALDKYSAFYVRQVIV